MAENGKASFKELEKMFADNKLSARDIAWEEFDIDFTFKLDDETETKIGLVKVVYDGREGSDKDQAVRVMHFIDHDVYVELNGWYNSNDGRQFDDGPYHVEPKSVTVTVYSPVE